MPTINLSDKINFSERRHSEPAHTGLWARTEVIAGYDRRKTNKGSYLGKELFRKSNIVPIGGVQYVMEKLFNVAGQVSTGYISDPGADFRFGAETNDKLNTSFPISPYSVEHCVCLFGVGTGGAPENSTSASDALYNERTLVQPIPFRVVYPADLANFPTLSGQELSMYWGKRTMDSLGDLNGAVTAYYLKKFDSDPEIIHLWRDNVDPDEDGTNVTDGGADAVFSSARTESIESFTEINLTISKKDLKQYFSAIGMPESARINELALYCAEIDKAAGDYSNIKLFSKLNFQTEPLSTTKDMEIIYRVYGS